MYFSQNEGVTQIIGSHEQPSARPTHSFIHPLTQLPLPSTELCSRNVKRIKIWSVPSRSMQFIQRERAQLCKTPKQCDIYFNRNVCTEDSRNIKECLDRREKWKRCEGKLIFQPRAWKWGSWKWSKETVAGGQENQEKPFHLPSLFFHSLSLVWPDRSSRGRESERTKTSGNL